MVNERTLETCRKKMRFASVKRAVSYAMHVRDTSRDIRNLVPYECPACGHYHLTSMYGDQNRSTAHEESVE